MNWEYRYLLEFYTQLISFEIVTSTFSKLQKIDRDDLLEHIAVMKSKREIILPSLQTLDLPDANSIVEEIKSLDSRETAILKHPTT
jgi:hypothetical protein